jgi:hypothetical protein
MELPMAENETTPDNFALLNLEGSPREILRSALPRLITRVDPRGGSRFNVTPYISQDERVHEEVISEGYDPDKSPLGSPVYWRIVRRGNEQFYLSTFLATREHILKAWGRRGLAYCDRATGIAVARVETKLSGKAA